MKCRQAKNRRKQIEIAEVRRERIRLLSIMKHSLAGYSKWLGARNIAARDIWDMEMAERERIERCECDECVHRDVMVALR